MRLISSLSTLLVLACSAPLVVAAAPTTTIKGSTAPSCPTTFAIAFTGKDGQTYVPYLGRGEDQQPRIISGASGTGSQFYITKSKLYRTDPNNGRPQYAQIDVSNPDDIFGDVIFVSDEYNKEYNIRNRHPISVKMNPQNCRLTFEYQDFVFTEWIQRAGTKYLYLAQDDGRPEPQVSYMLLTKAVAVPGAPAA